MKGVVTFAALALSVVAFSQIEPPPPGPPVTLTVSAEPWLMVLDYESGRLNPYTNEVGTVYADFECTASVSGLPANWSAGYEWAPTLPIPPGTVLPPGVLVFASGGSLATSTGTAYKVGVHTGSVTVTITKDDNSSFELSASLDVLAFGGPVKNTVEGSDEEPKTWEHDDPEDDSTPWYLQYFGHDPDQPDNSLPQRPQTGRVVPEFTQYLFTTMVYSVSGPHKVLSVSNDHLAFGSTGPTGPGAMVPKIKFDAVFLVDLEPHLASGWDCSQKMPNPESYTFTSHEPKSLTFTTNAFTNNYVENGVQWYGFRREDLFTLFDHLGVAMSGVRVQERYNPTYPIPSGMIVNSSNKYWVTDKVPDAGVFDSRDIVEFYIPDSEWTIGDHPNTPIFELEQLLVAGTRDTTWDADNGTDVAYFLLQIWTDLITRIAMLLP